VFSERRQPLFLEKTMGKGWPWRKQGRFIVDKAEKVTCHVLVHVDVAQTPYNNRTGCEVWGNVHTSRRQAAQRAEGAHAARALLPRDLLTDPSYGFDSTLWDTYDKVE
jgi:hypothetical protein